MATVLMKNPNFLILDEPTNDLDILTLSILEDYLVNFKGCVIVVSHDRFFLDRIVDHVFVFEGDAVISDFPGNYSQYREERRLKEREVLKDNKEKEKEITSKTTRPEKEKKNRLTFKEKRELETINERLPQLEDERRRIEEIIEEIDEKELRALELMEKEE